MAVITAERWLDAQQGVLGSALIEPKLVKRVVTETAETDYRDTNRLVFQAMRDQLASGQPVDAITVAGRLGPEYRKYIIGLMDITPTAAHFDTYVALVRDAAKLNRLQTLGAKLAASASADDAESIVSEATTLLIGDRTGKIWTAEALMARFMERHSGPTPRCLTWPIPAMDDALFVTSGKFLILSGEPSTGKSALALQCAMHWSQAYRVGYFSLETSGDDLFDRRMSGELAVPLKRIMQNKLTADEWAGVGIKTSKFAENKNLFVFDYALLSVDELKVLAISYKLDVVIVDYLQLLRAAGANDYERITNISLDLHRFAQSSGCNVVALSQHARQSNRERKNTEPVLASLRGSGQIEQDADVVLMLYYADPEKRQQRVIKCAKNKNGELFRMLLDFDGEHQLFSKARTSYGELQADMRRQRREEKQAEKTDQLTMLPDDTPVPFEPPKKK